MKLTLALEILSSGHVIVGSMPFQDGAQVGCALSQYKHMLLADTIIFRKPQKAFASLLVQEHSENLQA